MKAQFSLQLFGHSCQNLPCLHTGKVGARSPDKSGQINENYYSCFSTKTYVVGTQKNRLVETVLVSTQNIYFN